MTDDLKHYQYRPIEARSQHTCVDCGKKMIVIVDNDVNYYYCPDIYCSYSFNSKNN